MTLGFRTYLNNYIFLHHLYLVNYIFLNIVPIVLAATFDHKIKHKMYCCNKIAFVFILLHMRIIEACINETLFAVKN